MNKILNPIFCLCHRLLCVLLVFAASHLNAGGLVSFSYQGDLTEAGIAANGNYDFDVVFFTSPAGSSTLGGDSQTNVPVVDGVFTLDLAIADNALDIEVWMELRIRPSGGGSYTTLSPRQLIKGSPFAHRARGVANNSIGGGAIINGSINAQDINSTQVQERISQFCNNGSAIRSINTDGSVVCEGISGWSLTGNGGLTPLINFLGTTDSTPLEIRTNNETVMRYLWATAPGGGAPGVAIVGGYFENSVTDNSPGATIAGGGIQFTPNTIDGAASAIGGGANNHITTGYGTIAGGQGNSVDGQYASIPGGRNNQADGTGSVAMGERSKALHDNAFVFNDGSTNLESTAASQFLIGVADGVGIGTNDPSDFLHVSAPTGKNAMRVQVDGITRFRVHDNGGVSVGINSGAAPGGLRVAGHSRFLGAGLENGGVSGFNEVIARFETDNGGHTAISVDSEADQDAIVYFGENGIAKWALRTDASDQGTTSGILDGFSIDESIELRAIDGGSSRNFMTAQLYDNDDEAIGFPVDFVKFYGDIESERVYPKDTGNQRLGLSSRRWLTVYLSSQPDVSSDQRLKRDIQPLDFGLDEVMRLEPVSYELEAGNDDRRHLGLIAQQVQQVIPAVTTGQPDGEEMMSMRYPELIPVLIQAIQEQQRQLEAQQQQLLQQISEIEQLKRSVNATVHAQVGS